MGGDDVSAFFPVRVSFVGQGSIAGVRVRDVVRVDGGEAVVFSEDASVSLKGFTVV